MLLPSAQTLRSRPRGGRRLEEWFPSGAKVACVNKSAASKRVRPTGRAQGDRVGNRPPLKARNRNNRTQLLFIIFSSLIICGLIGAAVATVVPANLLDDSGADEQENAENFVDPNDDVISEQQTAVAGNPNDIEELLLLANLYANSSRLGDAIPIYEQVLTVAPQDSSARLSFARALADGGMTADAELQFGRVLELDPNSQQAHYYLAELLRLATPPRTAEAIGHYQRAAEIDGTTLISERSRDQLAALGAANPPSGTANLSTPILPEGTP